MENGDFDSISWANDGEAAAPSPVQRRASSGDRSDARPMSSGKQRATTGEPSQAGPNADMLDLAGVGDGRLDCAVDSPQKENEGTKDVFVSYRVTTHVGQAVALYTLAVRRERECETVEARCISRTSC